MNNETNNMDLKKNNNTMIILILGLVFFLVIVLIYILNNSVTFNGDNSEKKDIKTTTQNNETATKKIKDLASGSDETSTDVITVEVSSGASCTNTLAYDGTSDNNLRYVGENPCNYVKFNNELWRIVGVMNNIDDGEGKKETRIKLVRKDSLGTYSWDSSDSAAQAGLGINDWNRADLMHELNGDYLNTSLRENTLWYSDTNNTKNGEYDYTKGLNSDAQKLIGNAVWSLGNIGTDKLTSHKAYEYEKEYQIPQINSHYTCSDEYCQTSTKWTGKVALLYLSDYGFAVGDYNRECIKRSPFFNVKTDEICILNNWILPGWLLNFSASEQVSAIGIEESDGVNGNTYYNYVSTPMNVHPSVFLKSGVVISSGDGSSNNPYILQQ